MADWRIIVDRKNLLKKKKKACVYVRNALEGSSCLMYLQKLEVTAL